MKLHIKPMSVNKAWKGRRQKTDEYKSYEEYCSYCLPKKLEIPEGPLLIIFKWGFRNAGSDVDNPIKPFLDILQKKYRFNDNRVYQIVSTKIVLKKGQKEYIDFTILPFNL